MIALVIVCAMAYVVLRLLLPRLKFGAHTKNSNIIRVVERVGVDQRRSLMVVEVAGKCLLVGSSENGVNLVSELDAEAVSAAENDIEAHRAAQIAKFKQVRSNFADKLSEVMKRK